MENENLGELSQMLDRARCEARAIPPLTLTQPALSTHDAYRIQAEGIQLRIARGEKVVGFKVGLTSEAKRRQMGLHSPVYGVLTDAMQIPTGGTFKLRGHLHPKIEPEIAFRTSRELKGRITREEALEACEYAFAAMEILDSRFIDFKYFSLPDVIADNSSSSMFVIAAEGVKSCSLPLADLDMVMEVNGQAVQQAKSSAISGDPLISVVQLCVLLAENNAVLPAGSIVLTGAATAAHVVQPGDHVRLKVA